MADCGIEIQGRDEDYLVAIGKGYFVCYYKGGGGFCFWSDLDKEGGFDTLGIALSLLLIKQSDHC